MVVAGSLFKPPNPLESRVFELRVAMLRRIEQVPLLKAAGIDLGNQADLVFGGTLDLIFWELVQAYLTAKVTLALKIR